MQSSAGRHQLCLTEGQSAGKIIETGAVCYGLAQART
jgi:hypothetical protein